MQAILTKFIPPTNTRGSRYKATCQRGSITVSADHGRGLDWNHEFAAAELCRKFAREDVVTYGTPATHSPWLKPMVAGQLPDGTYAHVFVGEPK
jgi:hypothetical protein